MQESLYRQARAHLAKAYPHACCEKFLRSLTLEQRDAYNWLQQPINFTQYKGWGREFSRLVPLAACWKQYNNHPYSNLPLVKHLFWPVYPHLLLDSSYNQLKTLDLVGLRNKHCLNPQTQHRLIKLPEHLRGIPQIYWIWLCQIWVCHPQNRHQLTICDPQNLDHKPEPIIGEVFK